MTEAHIVDGQTVAVFYDNNITAANFTAANFASSPSNDTPLTVTQNGATGLLLEWSIGDDISSDANLTYIGNSPGIVSPQTIDYT